MANVVSPVVTRCLDRGRPVREKVMTDERRDPRDGDDAAPGAPRWVKVLALVALLLVVLLAVLHLTGNSLGGPGSHLPSPEQVVRLP